MTEHIANSIRSYSHPPRLAQYGLFHLKICRRMVASIKTISKSAANRAKTPSSSAVPATSSQIATITAAGTGKPLFLANRFMPRDLFLAATKKEKPTISLISSRLASAECAGGVKFIIFVMLTLPPAYHTPLPAHACKKRVLGENYFMSPEIPRKQDLDEYALQTNLETCRWAISDPGVWFLH